MDIRTIYCLLFMVTFFADYCNRESFLVNFHNNVFKHDVKAGNHESCLGNEDIDVKQQKFSP